MASILLMEDDPDQARMLATLLSGRGHECEITYTSNEAWAMLLKRRFDLLITDMLVPSAPHIVRGDGGLDLIVRIRNAKGADMPIWLSKMRIIAISGAPFRSDQVLERARIFGANLCLQKPARTADIFRAVDRLLNFPPGIEFPHLPLTR